MEYECEIVSHSGKIFISACERKKRNAALRVSSRVYLCVVSSWNPKSSCIELLVFLLHSTALTRNTAISSELMYASEAALSGSEHCSMHVFHAFPRRPNSHELCQGKK